MQIRRHRLWLVGALALTLGCSSPPPPRDETPRPQPKTPQPSSLEEVEEDRALEIQARNRAILERLEREQLERKRRESTEDEPAIEQESDTAPKRAPTRSGMDEMRARAEELEPRVAAIGRIAHRVDDNYRRYLDACYEKYTAATASPHTTTHYYDPYQPLAIANETTPYCRKLWSDIERDAEAVELAMRALSEEARRRGVLPGHVRDLARKYDLDRDGWRP